MKRAVLVLLAVAALVCAATANDKGMGTLAGTVLSQSGRPVADARVTSQGADGSHPQVTMTNAEGRFFFAQLVHGYYDVRAYHNGAWTDWKHNVEVNTGKQTEVKLQLPSAPKVLSQAVGPKKSN
ncbi:MAG: carboxypeptidase-like regulatory domain-containing protein [Candidatus Acidiferrales bacterium]